MDKIDIDPDLERQLQAAKEDEPVEAVLLLRHSGPKGKPPIDAEALMKRVHVKDDDDGVEINYMPRIGALIVRARSQLIRLLISQPEVEMASANHEIRD